MGHPKALTVKLGDESMRGILWQLPERQQKRKARYQLAIAAVVSSRQQPCKNGGSRHSSWNNDGERPETTNDAATQITCYNEEHCHVHHDSSSYGLQSSMVVESLSERYHRLCASRAVVALCQGQKDADAVREKHDKMMHCDDDSDDDDDDTSFPDNLLVRSVA